MINCLNVSIQPLVYCCHVTIEKPVADLYRTCFTIIPPQARFSEKKAGKNPALCSIYETSGEGFIRNDTFRFAQHTFPAFSLLLKPL